MSTHVLELGRGGPLWRDRFLLGFLDPKLVQKNPLFPSLEGAKSLEHQCDLRIAGEKAFGVFDVLDRKQSSLQINGQLLVSAV